MTAEALRMRERRAMELNAPNDADLALLNEKHASEIAEQMKVYKQDLTERNEKAQSQVHLHKTRFVPFSSYEHLATTAAFAES